MAKEDNPTGPTALRMIIGGQLRRLREAAGITRKAAGFEIRNSESKISRMELGRVSFRLRDVEDLMVMYGGTDQDEIDRVLMLCREANKPSWWHPYGDALPDWFQTYLDLESAASTIRTYEVQLVPGLLQSRDYARSLLMLGYGHTPLREIDNRIELRLARQKVLDREVDPPTLWTVIDEAALHRPFGGYGVMRDQLKLLIEACDRPNVRIQVVRFDSGAHSGAGAPFTWLRFAYPELDDVIYMEHLTGGLYLDRDSDVDAYQAAMEHLCVQASPPRDTQDIINSIIRDHYS
ncbi:helix-turn-helix domain-containing protein [Glycomyces mayteni]|uniref:Helix-turn-helix domain-containing protein n=1 Tax=Glycomyces mayteni TaxID=543887 RepID=A0ABW2DBD7_9ACTN|nr:helix-turn-helix transcriptional regulator [Glycomyces mayteni]